MKTNWLWDTRLSEKEVRGILKHEDNPRFNIYMEKLFARVSDPVVAFSLVDKTTFCRKWPAIKKRLVKDRWVKNRVLFWQTIYERIHDDLRIHGTKIREPIETAIPPERIQVARQIRDIRMKLGYTQNDLARKVGVIQQYVSKIEAGRDNVSIDTLKKIAGGLGRHVTIKIA